ncbi:hypothetical protein ACWIWK_07285 [Helicobacter sp. 23-1048]
MQKRFVFKILLCGILLWLLSNPIYAQMQDNNQTHEESQGQTTHEESQQEQHTQESKKDCLQCYQGNCVNVCEKNNDKYSGVEDYLEEQPFIARWGGLLMYHGLNVLTQGMFDTLTQSDDDNTRFYGFMGFYGKNSRLGDNKDSYGNFYMSASVRVEEEIAFIGHKIGGGIGIMLASGWGGAGFIDENPTHFNYKNYNGGNEYVITFSQLYADYQTKRFLLKSGVFEGELDWMSDIHRGIFTSFDYTYGKAYGSWINEYLHAQREEQSYFEELKNGYYGGQMFVLGSKLGTKKHRYGDIYAYHLTSLYTAFGGKLDANIEFAELYNLRILTHGNYLKAHRKMGIEQDIRGRQIGDTYLLTLQPSFGYYGNALRGRGVSWVLGGGYALVGKNDYLQAQFGGNMYVFEAEDETPFMFNVIAPGGYHNGSNATNMFQAQVESVYGFGAFQYNALVFNVMARHSKGRQEREIGGEQLQISVGFGLNMSKWSKQNMGIVAVYMEQKMRESFEVINPSKYVRDTSYIKMFYEVRF